MDTGDLLATQAFLRGDPWMHSFRMYVDKLKKKKKKL